MLLTSCYKYPGWNQRDALLHFDHFCWQALLFFFCHVSIFTSPALACDVLRLRKNYRPLLITDKSRQVRLRLRVFIGALCLQEHAVHWPFPLLHLHECAPGVRIKSDKIKHVQGAGTKTNGSPPLSLSLFVCLVVPAYEELFCLSKLEEEPKFCLLSIAWPASFVWEPLVNNG